MHRLGMVMATPLPEEGLDFRHIRPARDVFHGLVVNCDDSGANERFSRDVRQLDFHGSLFAREILGLGRRDVHIENPFFRWDDDFLDFAKQLAVIHGDGFDEEVRHVFSSHINGNDCALAIEPEESWRLINPVGRSHE